MKDKTQTVKYGHTTQDLSNKRVLNMEEVCIHTGLCKNIVYKLIAENKIPHNRLTERKIFFDRIKVEDFLLGFNV
jgi:predicted DNA-binding transcriptional regulator AlpA